MYYILQEQTQEVTYKGHIDIDMLRQALDEIEKTKKLAGAEPGNAKHRS